MKGLNISEENEEKIWLLFQKSSTYFNKRLHETGIDGLLQKYDTLVTMCEKQTEKNFKTGCLEYCDISYEYLNDIYVRQALEIIFDNIPESEQQRISEVIKPIDERLKKLLDSNQNIFRKKEIPTRPCEKYWWYYKLPECIQE